MIYIVKTENCDNVKIGYTSQLGKRLAEIKCQYKEKVILLRNLNGGRKTEKWLHEFFKANALGHEWFLFDSRMLTIDPPDFGEEEVFINKTRLGGVHIAFLSHETLRQSARKERRTVSNQAAYVLEKWAQEQK